MNKTGFIASSGRELEMSKIEWCDKAINPLGWGCYGSKGTPESPQPYSYCYGRQFPA